MTMAHFGASRLFRLVLAFNPKSSNRSGIPPSDHVGPADGWAETMANEGYEWQRHYEAAILETDRSRLPQLIEAAQTAIDARFKELRANHGGTSEEQ